MSYVCNTAGNMLTFAWVKSQTVCQQTQILITVESTNIQDNHTESYEHVGYHGHPNILSSSLDYREI